MSAARLVTLTTLAMLAFAGNSLLCRLALRDGAVDPATFTSIRVVSGAIALWLIVRVRTMGAGGSGNWWSAAALFVYAAAFSFAYVALSAATGALLLFGAVQMTMITYGLVQRERMSNVQSAGLAVSIGGLVWLLLPGITAPPLGAAALMLLAGVAWGIYSIRGKGAGDPTSITAGNFIRAVPLGAVLILFFLQDVTVSTAGVAYAIASGALTSGVGYAIWYTAVRELRAISAAVIQLSVPVITAIGGVLVLSEALTLRLLVGGAAVLGGIGLVVIRRT